MERHILGLRSEDIKRDSNALIERLNLLMASKQAGNTGVRNELVSICDALQRQNVIDKETYKKINSQTIKQMLVIKNKGYTRKYIYG